MTQRMPIPAHVVAAAQAIGAACEPAAPMAVYNGFPYYSRCKYTATLAAGVYTVPALRRRLFGYAIGGDMGSVGFTGRTATDIDTNITVAAQTNAGEDLTIYGMGLQIVAPGIESDPALAQKALPNIGATVQTQGRKGRVPIGPLDLIPGSSGIYGAAFSDAQGANVGGLTNGQPIKGNYLEIDGDLIWTAKGADSQLVVEFENEAFSFTPLATTPPATIDLVLRVQLFCTQLSKLSQNG